MTLPPDTAVSTPIPIGPPRTAYTWVKWRGRIPFALGIGIVLITFLAAVFAPWLTPYGPNQLDILNALKPPLSPGHLLGTDQYGRDELTRILYAARIDLLIAFGATTACLVFGSLYGLASGFFGGRIDAVLMRIVDIVFAFPFIVLVLTIIAILGPGLRNMFIAIWLVGWVPYARIVRGEVLVARRHEFVLAARALGFGRPRIMFGHLLPNVLAPAIIFSMLDAVNNVGLGAALGFLGLGVQDPQAEWGKMISDSQNFLATNWWLPTIPGLAIVFFGLGLSLIGDGLADRLRPE
jgi:peptide/nickel transport system permease protein